MRQSSPFSPELLELASRSEPPTHSELWSALRPELKQEAAQRFIAAKRHPLRATVLRRLEHQSGRKRSTLSRQELERKLQRTPASNEVAAALVALVVHDGSLKSTFGAFEQRFLASAIDGELDGRDGEETESTAQPESEPQLFSFERGDATADDLLAVLLYMTAIGAIPMSSATHVVRRSIVVSAASDDEAAIPSHTVDRGSPGSEKPALTTDDAWRAIADQLIDARVNAASLGQRMQEAGAQLARDGEILASGRAPGARENIEAAGALLDEFSEMISRVAELREALAIRVSGLAASACESIPDVIELLDLLLARVESERTMLRARSSSRADLERVLALTHRAGNNGDLLAVLHEDARELLAQEVPPDDEVRPYSCLLRLVEEGRSETLTDDEIDNLSEVVSQRFGRSLVNAALAGRLVLESSHSTEAAVDPMAPQHDRNIAATALFVAPVFAGSDDARRTYEESLESVVSVADSEYLQIDTALDTRLQPQVMAQDEASLATSTEGGQTLDGSHLAEPDGEEERIADVLHPPLLATLPPELPTVGSEVTQATAKDPSAPRVKAAESRLTPRAMRTVDRTGTAADYRAATQPPRTRSELAQSLLQNIEHPDPSHIAELVERLVIEGHLGLASAITAWAEGTITPEHSERLLPFWLMRALLVSPQLRGREGELAMALLHDLSRFDESVFVEGDAKRNATLRLLLAAAALRPALIAPETNAVDVLHRLHLGEYPALRAYCEDVYETVTPGMSLDREVLSRLVGHFDLQSATLSLQKEADDWLKWAPTASTVFRAAAEVWRALIRETGGAIHTLVFAVAKDDRSQLEVVRSQFQELVLRDAVDELIDTTDRKVVGRRTGREIAAAGRSQLRARIHEATELARRWLDLKDSAASAARRGPRDDRMERLAQRLRTRTEDVLRELDAARERAEAGDPLRGAALGLCSVAIMSIAALFDGRANLDGPERRLDEVLQGPLLNLPSVPVGPAYTVSLSHTELANTILGDLAGDIRSWIQAIEARAGHDDYDGAVLACDYAAASGVLTEEERAQETEKLRRRGADAAVLLQRRAESLRALVEQAFSFGMLSETERDRLLECLKEADRQTEYARTFGPTRVLLDGVQADVQGATERARTEARRRAEEANVNLSEPRAALLRRAIEAGDLLTTDECIAVIGTGDAFDGAPASEEFSAFFPTFVEALGEAGQFETAPMLIRRVRERRAGKGVSFEAVPPDQAAFVADAVEEWFKLKSQRGTPENNSLRAVLRFLGFNVLRLTQQREGTRVWTRLEASPLQDRAVCPSPFFGSQAHGVYRVLALWDAPSADEVVNAVRSARDPAPPLVLYFGRMDADRRQHLARLCREKKVRVVVIDETLLLYLASRGGDRLATMFRSALPFSFGEPFESRPGYVPPELFYGRSAEFQSLRDRNGSCFVFGGRQLGKTALLRKVERDFSAPEAGRIAVYIDLRGKGIGIDRSVQALWHVIVAALKERPDEKPVLPKDFPAQAKAERVTTAIRDWLDQSSDRRILLLLDEADAFFEQDGGGGDGRGSFAETARLKDLMDQTDRRFKVVFAGLHNVQRATTMMNHPVAHLGTPVCIGPLFDHHEWREARALIEEPLRAAGYVFEDPMLVWRILSQTNYYPSLIQLYCVRLLEHVNQSTVWGAGRTLPYVITEQHVRDAYQSKELRDQIRDRFRWTLDLDTRYRVVALALGWHAVSREPGRGDEALSLREIRKESEYWWRGGFGDHTTPVAFRALVEEMVGLGILRAAGEDRYALRGSNVALLLGTQSEIEEALQRLPRPEHVRGAMDLRTLRRGLRTEDVGSALAHHRSPLTAAQELEFSKREAGVSLIFGTAASALEDVETFLAETSGPEYFAATNGGPTLQAFNEWIDERLDAAGEGLTICYVRPGGGWDERWVQTAVDAVKRAHRRTRLVRVAFGVGPTEAWDLARCLAPLRETLEEKDISSFSLAPWHESVVRGWLDSLQFNVTDMPQEVVDGLLEVSDSWAKLLYELVLAIPTRQRSPEDLKRVVGERRRDVERWAATGAARAQFGLDVTIPTSVMQLLAQMDAMDTEDTEALFDVTRADPALGLGGTVRAALEWGSLLGLVRPVPGGLWEIAGLPKRVALSIHEGAAE